MIKTTIFIILVLLIILLSISVLAQIAKFIYLLFDIPYKIKRDKLKLKTDHELKLHNLKISNKKDKKNETINN